MNPPNRSRAFINGNPLTPPLIATIRHYPPGPVLIRETTIVQRCEYYDISLVSTGSEWIRWSTETWAWLTRPVVMDLPIDQLAGQVVDLNLVHADGASLRVPQFLIQSVDFNIIRGRAYQTPPLRPENPVVK